MESGQPKFGLPHRYRSLTLKKDGLLVYETKYSGNTADAAYSVYGVYDFEGTRSCLLERTGPL